MTSAAHPWERFYPQDLSPGLPPLASATSLVDAWRQRVAVAPEMACMRYFDGVLTAAEVDDLSDRLAVAFRDHGVSHGDRVGIRLQNVPQYALALLALWKLGAIAVLVNPMYRSRELAHVLEDSGAIGLIVDESDAQDCLAATSGTEVRWVVSTSARAFQTRDDPRVFGDEDAAASVSDGDLLAWIDAAGDRPLGSIEVSPDDIALLAYTSGTTGPPKGAMNRHSNVLTVASTYAEWVRLEQDDVVLAIAPLFHITGVVLNAVIALIHPTTLVLAHRFRPDVVLETFRDQQVTFTIGSITAFNALAAHPAVDASHFASVKYLYSGGAPIPPSTVERFQERFGHYIHNVYGMTETTAAVIAVPRDTPARLHGPSNTLSVGVPLPGLVARVIGENREELPADVQGELELSGPAIVPGYWRNEEATARTIPAGRLRTGDGAVADADGWIYLVDRIKDQINVSGYKVWPREVEDVLYEHPAVHEAAVVGKPDEYQGERVVAFVSLKPDQSCTEEELRTWVRERLAPYKAPREVTFVTDLPKTQTGKIRRAELRDAPDAGPTT